LIPDNSQLNLRRTSHKPKSVSHWRPHLSIIMMSESFSFNKGGVPSDVRRFMRVQVTYLPLLLVNELSFRVRDLMVEINRSSVQLPLTVSYEGISLRRFRFLVQLQDMIYSLRQFGFTEENIDEIKETLVGSNFYLLVLTAFITSLQLVCEFLALKNDISSWRGKSSMAGVSRKTGQKSILIIFDFILYMFLTSYLCHCSMVIFVFLPYYFPQVSRYLSYLVYPLCISGAIFSLAYLRQNITATCPWINTNVAADLPHITCFNFVYFSVNISITAFCFLQGFNTLISDLCYAVSFYNPSLSLTSSHQLCCFRDEVFLLLYLYQRRVNTFSNYTSKSNRNVTSTATAMTIQLEKKLI
uniref:Lipid scramblase CLPTM1L n=1 Tax=Periophthalmus magnuspinnatus TaxID=409849 RepID=A0A3B4BHA1_9GOBI